MSDLLLICVNFYQASCLLTTAFSTTWSRCSASPILSSASGSLLAVIFVDTDRVQSWAETPEPRFNAKKSSHIVIIVGLLHFLNWFSFISLHWIRTSLIVPSGKVARHFALIIMFGLKWSCYLPSIIIPVWSPSEGCSTFGRTLSDAIFVNFGRSSLINFLFDTS